ncbi:hypothetical protein [Carboxylicivirga sp. N1Y90]|uniref:hypothetical protein n=1 Tax=Carboxylicivirga fragile TaxID=3417571 RepID=UPI003D3491CA|nr:hypothetical protein [Marinilabiliaceae bacterium N1Y90]
MISLFSKGFSFLLQVILVVAVVLLFSWFDPFDLLAPTKTKLKNTPIQVESIKEIGKLITAEYYGEVIASLGEVVDQENKKDTELFSLGIKDVHAEFTDCLATLSLLDFKNKGDNCYEEFLKLNTFLHRSPLFERYLYFIFDNISGRTYKVSELNQELGSGKKERLFRRLQDMELLNLHGRFFRDIKTKIIS